MAESLHSGSLRRIRSFIPIEFKKELKDVSTLALPVFLSYVMVYLISFVSVVFCGHLGRTSLDGVTLATAIINVSAVSVGYGLATAGATLISQAFGSGNLKRVGVILQRMFLILMLACFPCWAILINTESLLIAVKQNPEVARLSQLYVKIYMAALPGLFMYIAEATYLQNQGIMWPLVISGALGNVINALCNYIFLFVLDLGIAGSAAANVASDYAMAIILFVYIVYKGLHKDTWHGFSMDCLQEWGEFMRLGIPGMLMLCAEWWTYELGAFLAGLISDVELGAQSVTFALANIAYMFPAGFSVAGGVRVGNALGAGNTEQAKLSAKIAIACAVCVSVCLAVIIGSSKDVISYIFSNDERIRERVSSVMVLYAPFHLFDAAAAAGSNIVRALGKQVYGAAGSLVGYYGIGFPIGVSLMFAAKMGIFGTNTTFSVTHSLFLYKFLLHALCFSCLIGLWSGLLICVFLQSVFFNVFLIKLNWVKATEEAQIRAGIQLDCTDNDTVEQANNMDVTDEGSNTDTERLAENMTNLSTKDPLPLGVLVACRSLTLLAMFIILGLGIALSVIVKR
ncbi:multidrug and toxin extrusion protein 1 isoform X1 [Hemibagrus wyckioides]|uniref:multidrug and toxin extrusion protein 1 isoform X1 n=1 Tax=Hemibagrus wyckioides TaxID=337641 RepID=UPI00266BCC99|nr:multidrug and toxin extrusion protein 1 isoform X1 [Hemibagrus wyckioides]